MSNIPYMNTLEELLARRPETILFECIAGSHAYGTANAKSDRDTRGIFAVPACEYLNLERPPDQVSDERGDVVYYSLRRVVELLTQANPNILELLFMPDDCVLKTSPEMQQLIAARDMFVSKQCADTHAGYAMSQIKKARGQNKWINNPKPPQPPSREDFCHVIPRPTSDASALPSRPIPLRTIGWDLAEYHAAKLEHARDAYRLYHYGADAKGVFRGDVLACESIPQPDEATRFAGLLLYNEQGWKQALTDHQNYWHWRRERNDARWHQQERGELDFDAKNMMHTVRLLMSGRSLLETGRPIVRFTGAELELLLTIRAGRRSFEEIMAIAEAIMDECERLKQSSALPERCDPAAASRLLQTLTSSWEQRHA